ncbi:hypothetical protein NDK50_08090 [Paraburkholderia bryophila]|uniref:hypothetical protein n=1 Tax=Paraburkholderia bryophila TaxID=420952 RepID=UPI00234BB37B|nr:hypothetical protein [Paraburkholderia bryophila]WCM21396.1 hypothetical protein NDK50_08090 [Paraburkholderia bryophila]
MTRNGHTTELQRAQWEASQKRQAARSVFERVISHPRCFFFCLGVLCALLLTLGIEIIGGVR